VLRLAKPLSETAMRKLKSGIVGLGILDLLCSCDLDLDPMTFIYKLNRYSLETCQTCYFKNFESYRLTDRQTNREDQNYIPRRFTSGNRISRPKPSKASLATQKSTVFAL